jgi:CheY-like chemotaxis protein
VLSDILDFSKIEAGQMGLEISEFDVSTLTARIASLHQAAAEAKGLELKWRVEPDALGVWRGDPVRLTQIQSNLLSNAVKFTDEGEVELTVERAARGLIFRVRDTGIGFDEETRGRLFRRFEQADASITRRFGGTGLGLAICRSLTELMGGRIQVESAPGHGATFSLMLPLERVSGSRRRAKTQEPPADWTDQALVQDRKLRILLAEDHPTNQRVVQMILEASGHELVIAENGRAALEQLQAGRFDVVLMDMQMPEMDGLTATTALRALEKKQGLAPTPVIMLTANALDEHVRAGRAAGADAHLSKPIRASALLETIAEVLPGESAPEPLAIG